MTDHDETLARIEARLNPELPPWPDQREENTRLQSANESLHHRLKAREFENSSLYRRIGELEEELRDAKSEVGRDKPGEFASLEQSADAIK